MLLLLRREINLHVDLQDIEWGDGEMSSTSAEHSSHCTEGIIGRRKLAIPSPLNNLLSCRHFFCSVGPRCSVADVVFIIVLIVLEKDE